MSAEPVAPSPRSAAVVRTVLQVVASVAVLGALFKDLDVEQLQGFLAQGSMWLLGLALLTKASGLLLHESRLWLALPTPRPPLPRVIEVGLAAGVLNLVLPARAGDIAVIAFLKRECGISPATGTMAVGITSILEAALFGLYLLAAVILGAHHMTGLLGDDVALWLSVFLGLSLLGGIGIVLLGRRIDPTAPHSGLVGFVKRTTAETAHGLSDARYLGLQTLSAALQVVLVVVAFTLAMPAAGIQLEHPELAASLILGASSILAVLLPPVFAAGPAAAAAAVLPVFGVPADQVAASAAAYAGAYWLVAHTPAGIMGLPALLRRR